MRINLLGKEIIFEIKEDIHRSSKLKNLFDKKYIYRFATLMGVFLFFGTIIQITELKANYKVGDIAISDIIAYKNVTYYKDIMDKDIRKKILENTTPEYDKMPEVENQSIQNLNNFFANSKNIKVNSKNYDLSVENYIKDNNYDLTVEDAKEILNRGESISYIVNLVNTLEKVYSVGINNNKDFDVIITNKEIKIDTLDRKFLKNFINKNLTVNSEKTEEKIQANIDSLKNKEIKIYRGDIVVKKGEVIDPEMYEKMEKLNLVRGADKAVKLVGLGIIFMILVLVSYYVLKKYSKKIMESNSFYPGLITIIILNTLFVLFFNRDFLIYLLPFAIVPIILSMTGDKIFALTLTFMNMLVISKNETAESIGANATFVRVASYYHDIGKLKRPNFFVENQKGGPNPHDNLKPSLSALIIISHAKDGYIMGKKHRLPKEILNIMMEHHGTTLVQYFYNKARQQGEVIREVDFRYSGPKPQTKESAIILLADTIEAAVRASEDKSKETIEGLIRSLIKHKMDDGQLSEANLTLKEIETVINAFVSVLLGAYHQRIQYQKVEDNLLLGEMGNK
jgi:putative nucleotidyltransferase with HDIG domain